MAEHIIPVPSNIGTNGEMYYYESRNIVAFPTTNSRDKGKLTSEENLRDIVTRITNLNYRLNKQSFNVSIDSDLVTVSSGSANINGYKVITDTSAKFNFENADHNVKHTLCMVLNKVNTTDWLIGDEYYAPYNENAYKGAYLNLYGRELSDSELKDKLFIGTIQWIDNEWIFTINPHIDCRIDPNDIYVDFFGKPDRSYHGIYTLAQFVDLTDDIYVSRFGDNVFGSLYFYKIDYENLVTNEQLPYTNGYQGTIDIPSNNKLGVTFSSTSRKQNSNNVHYNVSIAADDTSNSNGYNGLKIRGTNFVSTISSTESSSILSEFKTSHLGGGYNKITFDTNSLDTFDNGQNTNNISIISGRGKIYLESFEEGYDLDKPSYTGKYNLTETLYGNCLKLCPKDRPDNNHGVESLHIETALANSALYPKIQYCRDELGNSGSGFTLYRANHGSPVLSTYMGIYIDDIKVYSSSNGEGNLVDYFGRITLGDTNRNEKSSPSDGYGQKGYYGTLEISAPKYTKNNVEVDDGVHINNQLYVDNVIKVGDLPYLDIEDSNHNPTQDFYSSLTKDTLTTHNVLCKKAYGSAGAWDSGYIKADGYIIGARVYNAVYNDYADFIPKDKSVETYEPGDIIAKKPGSNEYTIATYNNRKLVVGVYSNNYGHILGGDNMENMEDNKKNYIPLGVAGNVDVKVYGPVYEGDLITVSYNYPGVGVRVDNPIEALGCIVGKALESNLGYSIKRVKMQIMLS